MFSYGVTAVEPLAETVAQIFLRPLKHPALTYQAGQYIEVIHPNHSVSPLSIACAPNETEMLEFHLFHSAQNQQALELLRMAKEEKTWTLSGPYGTCTASRLHADKPLIFLARGTGFAPIKAVMEALLQARFNQPLYFYWSVKTSQDLYLTDLIDQWVKHAPHLHFIPVLTQEIGSHVVPNIILRDHPDLSRYQVYASGPRPLITTAFSDFVQRGGLEAGAFYSDLL
jgi:CDP-4-dehydro-6-deoxyglucose reductase, E3